ncbi:MAG: dihydrolipoyl dehydrogenase [Candidatus Kerfeldbacteria bacterium]|nr:dihydrolipoyl dehydrogenase [Candidatus Kerfeldbacteria bacterium]
MTNLHYDVIVIGSGAGVKISTHAAKLGKKVALIEDGPLGGTCLNRGCIPSKLYIHTAELARAIRDAKRFNLNASLESIDFTDIVKRVTGYVDEHSQKMTEGTLRNPNITLYQTAGRFVDEKTIEVDGKRITADQILIAAGARPFIPAIEGLAGTPFLTSTEALRLDKLPTSLVIIGGGYIGTELAHLFSSLGTQVTVLQATDRLLDKEDSEIAQAFTAVFSRTANTLLMHRATRVAHSTAGFTITVEGPRGISEITAEQLLIATGVTPNSDRVDASAAGMIMDDRGFITVNQYLETNIAGVFALGDIVGHHMFRHAANWQARFAIQNMFTDQKVPIDYTAMPHAIFSYPQVAGVGATEDELKAVGTPYRVGRALYASTAMGAAFQEQDGFVKALVSADGQTILGCQIMGPEASTLIHEVVVAMRLGAYVSAITNTVHIHPAMNEVVQRAFMKLS